MVNQTTIVGIWPFKCLSWACFLKIGMDMLIVSRVAPTQNWTIPAERVMGSINLALQNCALVRTKLRDDASELHMKRCNGMSAVRAKAEKFSNVRYVSHDLDNPRPMSASVPSSHNPHQGIQAPQVLTPMASLGYENDNISKVAPDIHHPLSISIPSSDSPHQVIEAPQVLTPVACLGFEEVDMSTIDFDDDVYVGNVVDVAFVRGAHVVSITSLGFENNDMLTGDLDQVALPEVAHANTSMAMSA